MCGPCTWRQCCAMEPPSSPSMMPTRCPCPQMPSGACCSRPAMCSRQQSLCDAHPFIDQASLLANLHPFCFFLTVCRMFELCSSRRTYVQVTDDFHSGWQADMRNVSFAIGIAKPMNALVTMHRRAWHACMTPDLDSSMDISAVWQAAGGAKE